jgi:uncharacterized protein YbjT (DUF2867 family)
MTFQGTVVVLGANGETGRRTVANLRGKGIAVRAVVRSAEKAAAVPELNASGVEVFIGDVLKVTDLRRALAGAAAVISTLGSRPSYSDEILEAIEYEVIVNLVATAIEHGLRQIVMCSSMGTETPDVIPPLTRILKAKRRGELALEQGSVPYTIVRPGGLTNGPGGNDVLAARRLTGFGSISREDVAEVLVQALLQPAAQGKIVEIINQPGAGKATRPDLFG